MDPLPEAAQKALSDLYSKYGNDQTPEQKLNILFSELGEYNVSATADWRRSVEDINETKLKVMEHTYLVSIGMLYDSLC